MPLKGSNVVEGISDKLIRSELVTLASAQSGADLLFYDDRADYQVIDVDFVPKVAIVASQPVIVQLGVPANPTQFMNTDVTQNVAQAVQTVRRQILANVGTGLELLRGTPLILTYTNNGSQSGTGRLIIRLRPLDNRPGTAKGKDQ